MESIVKTKIWWVKEEVKRMFRLNRYLTDDPKPRISKTENVKVLDWLKSPVSTHTNDQSLRPLRPLGSISWIRSHIYICSVCINNLSP